MSAPPTYTISPGTLTDDERALLWSLGDAEVRADSWEEGDTRIAREVAAGRITARLVEPGRDGTRISVIERWDGSAALVTDNAGFLRLYLATDQPAATTAAAALLRSGSAYNW